MGLTDGPAAETGAAPIEIELKLEVRDPRAARRLLAAETIGELVAAGPIETRDLTDRYIDTAGGHLHRAGRVARLRAIDGEILVTVKSAVAALAGGVHRREEVEAPASDDLDPRHWPPSDARALVLELAGDRLLVELATIVQRRRVRRFEANGTAIEVSLDRVTVVREGRRVSRFVELEAELLAGAQGPLIALGERLAIDPAYGPARSSKLDRALAAVERDRREAARPHLIVGPTPGVTPTDHIAESGRKVLAFHFERLLAREAGTREGADPEQLHQMRVATRRLRAAWRTFGDVFDPVQARRLRRPLRGIATRLGAVRDIDVLLVDAEAHRATLDEAVAIAFEPLVTELQDRRERARIELVRALDAPAYGRWLRSAVTFLSTPGAGVPATVPGEPIHVRELAPARIWTAYGRLLAYDAVVPWADVPTLHAIRIEGKRLRYALEFFREALGPDVDQLIAAVTGLQDHLGALHDADVAGAVARELLTMRAASLTVAERHAIGTYVRARDADLRRLRRSAGRPWRRVAGVAFRRRLGRALAAL